MTVKRFLVRKFDFPEERFQTNGYGETRPLVQNDTETHRAMNRRVEFVNSTGLNDFRIQIGTRKRPITQTGLDDVQLICKTYPDSSL